MYTVLDFETTGLDYMEAQVIQIGAVKLGENFEELGSFSTYVSLSEGNKLPQLITNLTGITKADLEHGMAEQKALSMLQQFIGEDIVVAQFASFDLGFLFRFGYEPKEFICTKTMFNILFPDKKAGLKDIVQHYGIPYENHHDALYDAVMTIEVLKDLTGDIPKGKTLQNFVNVMTQQPDRPLNYVPDVATVINL